GASTLATFACFRCFCHHLASASTYTLSLHDALPIYRPEAGRADTAVGAAGRGASCGRDAAARFAVRDAGLQQGAAQAGRALHLRSEEHTSELQSRVDLVCRLLLEKKNYERERSQHHG